MKREMEDSQVGNESHVLLVSGYNHVIINIYVTHVFLFQYFEDERCPNCKRSNTQIQEGAC